MGLDYIYRIIGVLFFRMAFVCWGRPLRDVIVIYIFFEVGLIYIKKP